MKAQATLVVCSVLVWGCSIPSTTEIQAHQDATSPNPQSSTQPEIKLAPISQSVGAAAPPQPTLLLSTENDSYSESERRWNGATFLTLTNHFPKEFTGREITSYAQIWNITTGKALLSLNPEINPEIFSSVATNIEFSSDGKLLIGWGSGGAAIWDAASGTQLHRFEQLYKTSYSDKEADFIPLAILSPDESMLATMAGCENRIRLWSTSSYKLIASVPYKQHKIVETDGYPCQSDLMVDINFSPDGTKLISTNQEEPTRVSDTKTGKTLFTIREACKSTSYDGKPVTSFGGTARFSPDGAKILTSTECDYEDNVNLWDANTGKKMATLVASGVAKNSAFSPDGSKILIEANGAQIWDANSGTKLLTLEASTAENYQARFSPDGKKVLTTQDKTAKLFDAATGKELLTLSSHGMAINEAQFSPDGKKIITTSEDNTAKIWDAATGKPLFVLGKPIEEPNNEAPKSKLKPRVDDEFSVGPALPSEEETPKGILSATFSPDGSRVATRTYSTTTIWQLP